MAETIRFYSTKVPPHQSVGEVAGLLRKYGANRFEQVWENGRTVAIRFNLPVPDTMFGHMNILLKPRTEQLASRLAKLHRIDDPDQVERVAWRQLRGILEGILMAVDTEMFSVPELFLGMAETEQGSTLWEVFLERGQDMLLLTSGEGH